jgi:hypothetical protein
MTRSQATKNEGSDQGALPRPRSRLVQVEKLRKACLSLLHTHSQSQTQLEFETSPYVAELGGMTIKLFMPDFWLKAYSARLEYLEALSNPKELEIEILHGLNIWVRIAPFASKKVLNIEWDLSGNTTIRSFRSGPWEEILMTEVQGTVAG